MTSTPRPTQVAISEFHEAPDHWVMWVTINGVGVRCEGRRGAIENFKLAHGYAKLVAVEKGGRRDYTSVDLVPNAEDLALTRIIEDHLDRHESHGTDITANPDTTGSAAYFREHSDYTERKDHKNKTLAVDRRRPQPLAQPIIEEGTT